MGYLLRKLTPLALLLTLACRSLAASELAVIELNHRPPGQLIPELQNLYPQNQASFISDGQRLIVRADTQVVKEVRQLLQVLDVPVAQLRITVRQRETALGSQQGGGVSLDRRGVQVQAGTKTISTRSQNQHAIVVQSGQTAEVSTGQIRALPVLVQGGQNPAIAYQGVDVTSGLLVTPQLISGKQIELQILARDRSMPNNQLREAAIVTQRRVTPGEWVSLGGVEESSQQEGSGLVYRASSQQEAGQHFEVMVEIMP